MERKPTTSFLSTWLQSRKRTVLTWPLWIFSMLLRMQGRR
uniref:Serine (or cysteine) peptidase inhibitor, clade B, member 1c n=1 Tax=Mus musculus TaxID=10090 RepID=A0A1Y7VNU6_MOUSE